MPPSAAVVIDDADAPDRDEAALFHLHNLLAPSRSPASDRRHPAARLGPDPARPAQPHAGLPPVRLDPPDDALLSAVLVKLFADRQIAVPPNLIPYLVNRMERSIAAARALWPALDAAALAAGRPITRALAAEFLDARANSPHEPSSGPAAVLDKPRHQ